MLQKTLLPSKIQTRTSVLLIVIAVLAMACAPVGSPTGGYDGAASSDGGNTDYDRGPTIVTESTADDGAAPTDASGSEGAADSVASSGSSDSEGPTIVTAPEAEASESAIGGSGDSDSVSPAPRPTSRPPERPQQSAALRAGEVDDNEDWADYLDYRRNYYGPPVHERDISERYIIQALDQQGYPVLNANVRVYLDKRGQNREIYQAYTYADGRALFHPKTLGYSGDYGDRFLVVVKKGNVVGKVTIPRDYQQQQHSDNVWAVKLDLTQQVSSVNLDVLFLLDSTGSMGDEIHAIQSTIFDVAEQIDNLPENPNVRYGLVTYRDRGDAYISKTYGFEKNVSRFARNLDGVYANGGGDYPESLNEGLHNALHDVSWRSGDTVRLIFLIADAPPHLDYRQDYDYAVEMDTAARSAIKVFPIASSGLDEQGEYIFRQIAQFTQGRFIFLTYDGPSNGGKAGDVTTHNVDSYSVSNLDDLLVDLVTHELSHQSPLLSWRQ